MARFPMNSPDEYGRDALHYAASDNDLDWMRERLAAGVDPDLPDYSGWRPLHSAVQTGAADAVRLLLDAGADVHARVGTTATPLHLAATNWHMSPRAKEGAVIRLLLEAGADTAATDRLDSTPADIGRYMYRFPPELLELLETPTPAGSPAHDTAHLPAAPERPWYGGRYPQEAAELWQRLVPPLGRADTVQGELLRAVEQLRGEAHRNGNLNWDTDYRDLTLWLRATLLAGAVPSGPAVFDQATAAQISRDVDRLLRADEPDTSDEPYDRLIDRVVEWCRAHPDPRPRQ